MKNCENCNIEFNYLYGSGRFCSKKCACGFSTKLKRKEINEKISKSIREKLNNGEKIGCVHPNKDLDNGYHKKKCINCNKEYKTKKRNQKYCSSFCVHSSSEFRKKISEKNKGVTGGIRKGSGRGKSGWYKGFWCDSSYELAWVIYNIDHNINFKRNTKSYTYVHNNEIHEYFPDFIINDELIEIKGFLRKNDISKFNTNFDMKLNIFYKKDIKTEINYAISKFGKNYIKLYENNPYNEKLNKCQICGKPCKNKYCCRKCSGIGVSKK